MQLISEYARPMRERKQLIAKGERPPPLPPGGPGYDLNDIDTVDVSYFLPSYIPYYLDR